MLTGWGLGFTGMYSRSRARPATDLWCPVGGNAHVKNWREDAQPERPEAASPTRRMGQVAAPPGEETQTAVAAEAAVEEGAAR